MKKYLVVTIDTEPDCTSTWHYSNPLKFNGVLTGIKDVLQPLFRKFNIVPTYLINNVVLENDESINVLKNLNEKVEFGTHLHPEFIEPQKQFIDYAGKKGEANCCFYPADIEFEKIKSITELFKNKFGYSPTSFRAGRYSAGSNTIKSLAKLGYKVDTSFTPHIRWDDHSREKAVDFRKVPEQPYLINENDLAVADPSGKIFEVPISIALTKRNLIRELVVSGGGLRHGLRKHKTYWLRPYYSDFKRMQSIVNNYISSYRHRDYVVFNMMFHNVEILPGLSPYTKTEADCSRYLQQLELFFKYCNETGIESLSLTDLYYACSK